MSRVSPLLNIMIQAAEKASRSLLRDFGEVEQLQVSQKGPGDFVSAADIRAEKIIKEELLKYRSGYSFLMEESGLSEGQDKDHVWIVDPLDGTMNFLHGVPHWAISIALQDKGEIVAALVYDPVKDEMFTAEKGQGAFIQRRKRLRVSGRSDMDMAMIATGAPRRALKNAPQFNAEYKAIQDQGASMRRFGAAALDLVYVAAGRCEGFWERALSPWDIAAGYLIVKESGGFICDLDDDRKNPVDTGNVIAANGGIYNDMKKTLRSC